MCPWLLQKFDLISFLAEDKSINCLQNIFEFKVQCRYQVLITTSMELGHKTGVAGDRWQHCHCYYWNDHGLPAEETSISLHPEPLLNVLSPFLMTGHVNLLMLSPTGQRKWPISATTRTDALFYHLTFVPLPSQVGFHFISFWSADWWKSFIFSKPVWAPDCGPGGPRESSPQPQLREVLFTYLLEILSCWQETLTSDFNSDK